MNFNDFYTRYYPPICARAYGYLHNQQDAEEVAQDTLLAAWRHYSEIGPHAAPAWLYKAVRNKCIDAYRHRLTIPADSLEASGVDVAIEHDEDACIDMQAFLARIPPPLLYVAIGYSYREAAARFGYSEDAVRMVIRRARIELRKKRIA